MLARRVVGWGLAGAIFLIPNRPAAKESAPEAAVDAKDFTPIRLLTHEASNSDEPY